MKATLFLPIACFMLCITAPDIVHAQYTHYNNNQPKNDEFTLSEGIVTLEELKGWNGPGGVSGYVSMPATISGAVFFTYRHFFTRRFAAGLTCGLDNESGDLSYGNPEHGTNLTGYDGVSGHYTVHSYTLALEGLFAYIKTPRFMFYGYAGAGATMFKETYLFYPNAPHPAPVTLPSNPYDYNRTYFNAQVSPLCIRFGGDIAGFIESGFGYKGLICGGLSARF